MKYFTLLFFTFFLVSSQAQSYKHTIKKHRKSYKKTHLENERGPFYHKKKEIKKLRFYAPDENYKVTCQFTRTPDTEVFKMATYSGKTKDYKKYGELTFQINGHDLKLAIYQNIRLLMMPMYKDHLFIPFKDFTNDEATYGGGRYIDIKIGDIKNGELILDLNKAYNPWCAFSDGYNCPVPPRENHLEFKVEAGEKSFAGEKSKAPK